MHFIYLQSVFQTAELLQNPRHRLKKMTVPFLCVIHCPGQHGLLREMLAFLLLSNLVPLS